MSVCLRPEAVILSQSGSRCADKNCLLNYLKRLLLELWVGYRRGFCSLHGTVSGKAVELAVRAVIHGEDVSNVGSLVNPEALQYFNNLPELA